MGAEIKRATAKFLAPLIFCFSLFCAERTLSYAQGGVCADGACQKAKAGANTGSGASPGQNIPQKQVSGSPQTPGPGPQGQVQPDPKVQQCLDMINAGLRNRNKPPAESLDSAYPVEFTPDMQNLANQAPAGMTPHEKCIWAMQQMIKRKNGGMFIKNSDSGQPGDRMIFEINNKGDRPGSENSGVSIGVRLDGDGDVSKFEVGMHRESGTQVIGQNDKGHDLVKAEGPRWLEECVNGQFQRSEVAENGERCVACHKSSGQGQDLGNIERSHGIRPKPSQSLMSRLEVAQLCASLDPKSDEYKLLREQVMTGKDRYADEFYKTKENGELEKDEDGDPIPQPGLTEEDIAQQLAEEVGLDNQTPPREAPPPKLPPFPSFGGGQKPTPTPTPTETPTASPTETPMESPSPVESPIESPSPEVSPEVSPAPVESPDPNATTASTADPGLSSSSGEAGASVIETLIRRKDRPSAWYRRGRLDAEAEKGAGPKPESVPKVVPSKLPRADYRF